MSTTKVEINLVTVTETVLLKIVKHANQIASLPQQSNQDDEDPTIGKLMGYYNEKEGEMEISTCYPLPQNQMKQKEFQEEMSKRLDQNGNIDNLDIGWYQVSYKADHLVKFDAFETAKGLQMENPLSIYFVYDILAAKNGDALPFKAYKLNEQFIQLSNDHESIDQEELKKYCSQLDKIFIPVQVEIKRNPLNQAFLNMYGKNIKEQYAKKQISHPSYDIGSQFSNNAGILTESVSELSEEYQKHIEWLQEQKQLVQEKRQAKVQIQVKKHIDQRFINERVNFVSELLNQQTELNQKSQVVLESLKSQK